MVNKFIYQNTLKENITYYKYNYEILFNLFGYKKTNFLNKLNYWIHKCGRQIDNSSNLWVYNPLQEWAQQLNCSISTIKRVIKYLEKENIIFSQKPNARKWNHTKWYSINYEKLNLLLNIEKNEHLFFNKKRANRTVQKEPIIIYNNNNNYTSSISSFEEKTKLKREEAIIKNMVYLWNKVFEYSLKPIKAYCNKKNQYILLNLYKTIFKSDLNKWREYAYKVNSSQFLMGEKKTKNNFKALFSWLIKEETIEKILNGEYGVGDRELDINNISKNIEEKKEEIVNKMDKKLSEYMKIKINDKEEREKFIEYIRSASTTEDDSYGVLKNIIKQVPKSYILEREEYKGIKENIYESYVMKKYLGYTKLDIREKMRERTKKIDEIDNVEEKMRLLKEIEEKIKTKECIANNLQSNEEMGNYSSGLLELILLSNPKKESRYLKGSSGESSIMDLVT
ncbi:hypothetical protein [Rickettsiales endosymbiont of Trichoplax sp. H2]|uniref:hypothetical protein n=1 Tax=Rickettsiales endosymbiont of Trichoplax sp. H2 TaxID=2021221 RepID=UPI0012B3A639|nr:hypothetical protein [Rickettsiales endosymbiont of Trichoplax sp. H2]